MTYQTLILIQEGGGSESNLRAVAFVGKLKYYRCIMFRVDKNLSHNKTEQTNLFHSVSISVNRFHNY